MFRKIRFFNGKKLEGWNLFLEELSKDNATGIMLFIADKTPFEYKKIQPYLQNIKIDVWGCIFPKIIYDNILYEEGIVGCAFQVPISIEVIKDLQEFTGTFSKEIISENTESLLIFNDGWANNIPLLIESLYEMNEKDLNFIGGGTGSMANMNRPSLFTSEDYFAKGAIIVAVEDYISIGINHGWKPIYDPFIATRTNKHILQTINWESAFEYYKRVIKKDTGIELTDDNFLSISKSYPFGIIKYDDEIIMRVPIQIQDQNSILMSSEIPENSVLVIMKGYPGKLIKAAGMAVEQAKTDFQKKQKKSPTSALIIDCITREFFLEDKYKEELNIIKAKAGKDIFMFGFLSLGEIASTGSKYIELHNKTVVIGMGE